MNVLCCKYTWRKYNNKHRHEEWRAAELQRVQNKSPSYFPTGHLQSRSERKVKAATCLKRNSWSKKSPHSKYVGVFREQLWQILTKRRKWQKQAAEGAPHQRPSSWVYLGCVFGRPFRFGHCSCSSCWRSCGFDLGGRCSLQTCCQMITHKHMDDRYTVHCVEQSNSISDNRAGENVQWSLVRSLTVYSMTVSDLMGFKADADLTRDQLRFKYWCFFTFYPI